MKAGGAVCRAAVRLALVTVARAGCSPLAPASGKQGRGSRLRGLLLLSLLQRHAPYSCCCSYARVVVRGTNPLCPCACAHASAPYRMSASALKLLSLVHPFPRTFRFTPGQKQVIYLPLRRVATQTTRRARVSTAAAGSAPNHVPRRVSNQDWFTVQEEPASKDSQDPLLLNVLTTTIRRRPELDFRLQKKSDVTFITSVCVASPSPRLLHAPLTFACMCTCRLAPTGVAGKPTCLMSCAAL